MPAVIRIDERDHVGVALVPLKTGQHVTVGAIGLIVRSDVPAGHKIALAPVAANQTLCKFGHAIGRGIEAGEHVHDHNLGPLSGEGMAEIRSGADRIDG